MMLRSLIVSCLSLLLAGLPLAAQEGPFAVRVMVNDRAVTQYEVDQRRQFLELLRSPGDLDELAITTLIEDRLRLQAAEALEIEATPEQVTAGMTEFAGRAQLQLEEFLQAIAQGGVAEQSFRDFVTAGLVWRDVVRARFGPRASITEAEIDRALALSSQRGAVRVLISELILPATPEYAARSRELADRISSTVTTEAAFEAAAREYSVSPTRDAGGRLDWVPLANLPPEIASLLLGLSPGQVSAPVPIPNAIALFQLRAIDDSATPAPESVSVDYAQFYIPGGRSEAALAAAAALRTRVDTCDDLYAEAKGLPPERLSRETLAVPQVPQDIALELARLDENESSVALVRGDALVFLMLCKRTLVAETPPSRDDVRVRLVNQRLASLADAYLAELMANAHIAYP